MITIWEHFGLFILLSLVVSLVYSGLRNEHLSSIIKLALKRFVFFMIASALFAVAIYFFAYNL